jgi:hypothetical protein
LQFEITPEPDTGSGQTIAALTQFTGHPVTAYHPERPVVFGEWPQVACDALPPFRKPAGDVLADHAVRILDRFAKETTDHNEHAPEL